VLGLILGVALVRRPRWLALIARVPVVLAFDAVIIALIVVRELPSLDVGPAGFGLLWVVLIASCAPAGRARLLAARPMRVLGEASYSIYLLHWPIWTWYTAILGEPEQQRSQGWSSAVQVILYFAIVIAAALASWRFIESPIRRAVRSARRDQAQ